MTESSATGREFTGFASLPARLRTERVTTWQSSREFQWSACTWWPQISSWSGGRKVSDAQADDDFIAYLPLERRVAPRKSRANHLDLSRCERNLTMKRATRTSHGSCEQGGCKCLNHDSCPNWSFPRSDIRRPPAIGAQVGISFTLNSSCSQLLSSGSAPRLHLQHDISYPPNF